MVALEPHIAINLDEGALVFGQELGLTTKAYII